MLGNGASVISHQVALKTNPSCSEAATLALDLWLQSSLRTLMRL